MGRSILIFMNSNNNHSLVINNKLGLLRLLEKWHTNVGVKNLFMMILV